MDLTRYTTSLINLDLTANKVLFRIHKTAGEKKREELMRMVCDLDQVKETLKELKAENDELMRKLWKLHSENLELNELKKILE